VRTVLRDAIRRLEECYPHLTSWFGGRLDIQLPAFGASLVTHLVLLGVFGMIAIAAHTDSRREFRSEVVDTALTDFAKMDATELAAIDDTVIKPSAGSFAPTLSARVLDTTPPLVPPQEAPKVARPEVRLAANLTQPGAPRLDTMLSIKGTGAEHVDGVEGGVDRIAIEILRRVEKGRTLVVWAFDASGSLQVEREKLAKYIGDVYTHISQLDRDRLAEDGGLLTSVVSFGKDRKILTPEPTADAAAIVSAINAVPLDESGVESTFQTVAEIIRKYARFHHEKQTYSPMVVVVTDEVGDDEDHLEEAIALATKTKVPVYVLGNGALFGRVEGYMNYTDPKTKQVYYNLPVRQGPESVMLEGIRLPFWYDGPQYDFLDAGFGPYALSRLARASGGIYFVTRLGGHRIMFDPAGMREYTPDLVGREQYIAAVERHPLRLAVMRAAQITQQALPGQPSLRFPAADGPEFKEAMARNQEIVARVQYTVDEALAPIAAVVKKRDHETSRRWQAHYDLIRGRLLAMKLRCYEYNWICARMKKDPTKFANPASNAWRLVPDKEVHSSDKAASVATEAKALLERVVKDHPGTPWALLAQRELKDPFGFRWEETHVPPIQRRNPADAAAAKKKKEAPKNNTPPPPVPKL
jgi:hypothetical protein